MMDVDYESSWLNTNTVPVFQADMHFFHYWSQPQLSVLLGRVRYRDDSSELKQEQDKRFKFSTQQDSSSEREVKTEQSLPAQDDDEDSVRFAVANSRRRGVNIYASLESARKVDAASKRRLEEMRRREQAEEKLREEEQQISSRYSEILKSRLNDMECWRALNLLYPEGGLTEHSGQAAFSRTIKHALRLCHPDKNKNVSIERQAQCSETTKLLNLMKGMLSHQRLDLN